MSIYDIAEKIEKKYHFEGEPVRFFTIDRPGRRTKFCKAIRELGRDIDYIIEMRKNKISIPDRIMEKLDRRISNNYHTILRIIADIIRSWSKSWLERGGSGHVRTGSGEAKLEFYNYRPDIKLAHVKEEDYEAIIEEALIFYHPYKTAYVAIPDAVICETAFVDVFAMK